MNRKILITGGTKGLGFATASLLAREGAELYLTYRSDQAGAEVAAEALRAAGASRCVTFACDLSEEGAADRMFDQLASHTKQLDVYIHNAAATAFKDLRSLKAHHIDKTFNITVKSFILGVQRAVDMMSAGSSIVTVSGMDTLKAVPWHGLLGAAKSALETLTAYYAHELASKKIQVNCVNPGFLKTDSTQKYLGASFDQVNQAFAEMVPLEREPNLAEVAEVILFLASARASWIVGQTINVDGGLDFSMPRAFAGRV